MLTLSGMTDKKKGGRHKSDKDPRQNHGLFAQEHLRLRHRIPENCIILWLTAVHPALRPQHNNSFIFNWGGGGELHYRGRERCWRRRYRWRSHMTPRHVWRLRLTPYNVHYFLTTDGYVGRWSMKVNYSEWWMILSRLLQHIRCLRLKIICARRYSSTLWFLCAGSKMARFHSASFIIL